MTWREVMESNQRQLGDFQKYNGFFKVRSRNKVKF